MLKSCVLRTGLVTLALLAWPAGHGMTMPLGASRPDGVAAPLIEVKLKCGLTKDGTFVCKNDKKHKNKPKTGDGEASSNDEQKSSKKTNKCEGPNDCGPGYRDLDAPNRYGACCEEIKDEAKDNPPDGPKSGTCQQVEAQNEMNCTAPFDVHSCGAPRTAR